MSCLNPLIGFSVLDQDVPNPKPIFPESLNPLIGFSVLDLYIGWLSRRDKSKCLNPLIGFSVLDMLKIFLSFNA